MKPIIKTPHATHHTEHELHTLLDPHQRSVSGLSDIILGGQDGLVNVLGVILGVAAASSDSYRARRWSCCYICRVCINGSGSVHLHTCGCRLLR